MSTKSFSGTDLVVYDPQDTFRWSVSPNEIEELEAEIFALLPDPDDPFQKFLRGYLGVGDTQLKKQCWRGNMTRMALNFRLIEAHLPPGGMWVDAGAYGLEAPIVKSRRPDANFSLYNYEGCALIQDEYGLHFLTEFENRSDYIRVEQVDLERHNLNLPDSSVDVFATFETIEHFKFGPQHFIHEANRVLKLGGRIIVSTPNAHSINAYEKLILNKHPAECPYYHLDLKYGRKHPLEYDRDQITCLLIENGFEIESLVTANLIPMPALQYRLIKQLICIRQDEGLQLPQDFGAKWFAIARKVSAPKQQVFPSALFK